MSNWIPVVITKKGLALQAKVEAGTVLKFTKMALGSGKPPDLATATALASLKQNLAIASKDVNNNTCVVYATGTNIGVTTAYQASELGLYAQDPDEGEILYAVTTDDTPDTVPSNSSATVITQRIGLAVAVSASSTVSVVLSTTGFITAADAENIANDVMTAHKTKTPLDHPAKSVQEKHLADGAVSTRALSKTGVAAGTYKSVTVDVKGRVTGGTNPTTLGGYGITDAYPKSTSDARYLPIAGKAVDAAKADGLTPTNLGDFTNKTVGDLKAALSNWLNNTPNTVACCTFIGGTKDELVNGWGNDASGLPAGWVWTVTTLGCFSGGAYRRLLLSNYFGYSFFINIVNGSFSHLLDIAIGRNLITSINGVSTPGGAVDLSSVFLRLTGGTLTGPLTVNRTINLPTNASLLDICGGIGGYSNKSAGGVLLYGKEINQSIKGGFILYTTDGTINRNLMGFPSGRLVWDNADIVRKVHGQYADSNGAVNIPNVTQSTSGVMTPVDKAKLDGIEANANKYTLPPAGASVLGGIKVGANLGISNGVLSGAYATATTSAPGLLRRLSGNANDVMTGTGVWSSNNSITAQSLRTNGYVKFGNGFIIQWGITAKATLSVTFPIPFPNNLLSIVQGDLYSDRGDRMTYDEKRINTRTNTGFTYNSASCERAWVAIGY